MTVSAGGRKVGLVSRTLRYNRWGSPGRAAGEDGMAVNQRLLTADELIHVPDDGQRLELVRGELRAMPPGGWEHGCESIEIAGSLAPYVRRNGLGRVAGADTGFRLTTDPDTVGGAVSSGCIRLRNEDVEVLYEILPEKADVVVQP